MKESFAYPHGPQGVESGTKRLVTMDFIIHKDHMFVTKLQFNSFKSTGIATLGLGFRPKIVGVRGGCRGLAMNGTMC